MKTGVKVSDILPRGWVNYLDPAFPKLGLGFDVATTLKAKGKRAAKTNPSVLWLTQQVGLQYIARLILRFRTNDPKIATALIEQILIGVTSRGLRIRKLCVDATNERFFAANLKTHFSGRLVVEPVVSSEGTIYLGQSMKMKAYLGNLLVEQFEDGYVSMPEADWLQADMRLAKKVGETFDNELDENGNHGDTFDGAKLSLHALVSKGGPAEARAASTGSYGAAGKPQRKVLNPFAHRYGRNRTRRAI